MTFRDRTDAGRQLAQQLLKYRGQPVAVFALPRGGAEVAAEVASALNAPLDLLLVRKIGAPMQPELAIGAVVDGLKPAIVRNEDVIAMTGTTNVAFDAICKRELEEIERRRRTYLIERPPLDPEGKIAIVIDDGLATGATMRVALRVMRQRNPKKLILAVPVGPWETVKALEKEADEVVCLSAPDHFYALGYYYDDFRQLSDDDVIGILGRFPASKSKPPC